MAPVESELVAELDDEPDERHAPLNWTQHLHTAFAKANPHMSDRRESLLTRQLHSETEHTDDDEDATHEPPRALSTQSTWSNPSVASTAELTSDDGHSVASSAMSPPLPPTVMASIMPLHEKPLAKRPRIAGQEASTTEPNTEQSVEAGLGRKRCISFACGNKKQDAKPSQPTSQPAPEQEPQSSASPPKRKCALKFVCPSRTAAEGKPPEKPSTKRPVSPPPPARKSTPRSDVSKTHRGSDSTVTHVSPRNDRKSPARATSTPTAALPLPATAEAPVVRRRLSDDSDGSTAATRFHEFASSDDEPEEWVQESTCYKSRLTVSDTLVKENTIRKACEEVEEEVLEEEDEDEEDADKIDEDDADEDDDEDDNVSVEEEEESDEGFRTDDEEGFADSDEEDVDSDEEWWTPGGPSTAATSVDHLDRLPFAKKEDDAALSSSVNSASSAVSNVSPRVVRNKALRKHEKRAVPIRPRSDAVDLPDSTDFVCGTLDEDRPLEQAYLNHMKLKEAAKRKARPQDIDPTFPTSDPEMDEEDDDDLEDPEESHDENLMHGELDELDGDLTARRRASPRPRARSNAHRSPPPPPRARSPAPRALKRTTTARSPPPPVRRSTARSPPPRKLFGHSPSRLGSPTPVNRTTSPPNTRRASPTGINPAKAMPHVLASRPQLTHTASLPRGGFMLGKLNNLRIDEQDGSDTEAPTTPGDVPKRGAIDIFKGLEKKRQRRKEKLYQKACAKAAAKGERPYKVKPGKGAERMREVGLELQRYHGKGEHILSL